MRCGISCIIKLCLLGNYFGDCPSLTPKFGFVDTRSREFTDYQHFFCSVFQSEPYKSFLLSFSIFVFFSLLSFCHCVFCLRLIPSRKIPLEKSRPDNPLFVGSQCGDGPTVSQVLNVSSMMCLLSTNPITAVIALS